MLGKNIRKYREALNLTQEQLASRLNISPQAISKWERGESQPDCPLLTAIADTLGVSLDRLFGRETADFADAVHVFYAYMRNLEPSERLNAHRRLALCGECAMLGIDTHALAPNELTGSVCNESDYGFTFSSNRPELPFYSLFVEPKDGWRAVLNPMDFREFFEIMSECSVLDALSKLYECKSLTFDTSFARLKLGLSEPEMTLAKLERLGILHGETCIIDGIETRIYTFRERCGLIAILALVREFLDHNRHFDLQSDIRALPYFR